MKLKSFGCSFIFGTDLHDDGRHSPFATPSHNSWPALIAKHFGMEYRCYARPGSGNLQILERLLNALECSEPAIYVIGWTYIDRFDYVNPELVTPWHGTKWSTLMPIDTGPVADAYFQSLHAEYSDKLRSLIYIKTVIDCLKQSGSKFVMTSMDPLIQCRRWHTTRATAMMADYIEPYLSTFQGQNFLEWSRSKGFAISATMHPLETAHRAAADMILTNWDHYLKS